jgi:hypothetical protein
LVTNVRGPPIRIRTIPPSTNDISLALMNCGATNFSDAATLLGRMMSVMSRTTKQKVPLSQMTSRLLLGVI